MPGGRRCAIARFTTVYSARPPLGAVIAVQRQQRDNGCTGPSRSTDAVAAGLERLDRHQLPARKILDPGPERDYFAAQLVTEDHRVLDAGQRMGRERVVIGPS